MLKKYFEVSVNKYDSTKKFCVYRPSSLEIPKDNAVTFISAMNMARAGVFEQCRECLIFWPEGYEVPNSLYEKNHAIIPCENPHLRICQFYAENNINNLPVKEKVEIIDGAFISPKAKIGKDTIVQPGAYIGGEVEIGENCYIGAGAKLIGEIHIGNHVIVRENAVIGADGLTTDRDETGKPVKMPQFGNVVIADYVMIGANAVVQRGAIDSTFIDAETSIDNSAFVSHNAQVGKRVFMVTESVILGSVVVGDNAFISGNSTVRNGVTIGQGAVVGMGSVVVKDVDKDAIVKGNPAK